MKFETEQDLITQFVACLVDDETPWGQVRAGTEFYYLRGRTDVIAVNAEGDVLAFEAKLRRWRQALQQAYKNTCFAHRSYVVLPEYEALAAARFQYAFQQMGVGLCYPREQSLVIVFEPLRAEPLQPWLTEQATKWAISTDIKCLIQESNPLPARSARVKV